MTINQKLAQIQTKFKSKKSRFNSFGKYNFRSAEDILEATKPFLLELGVSVRIEEDIIDNQEFPILKSTAIICDGENAIRATAIVGVDLNQKGMQMPQKFGSASSYGKKYALVKAVPDLGQVTITGVADTDPAVITPVIGDKAMIEDATLQVDFSASTTGADAISFTSANLPSFATLTDNGDNTGKIVFMPVVSEAGDYQDITVIADNGRSFTSQSFQLSVSPDSGGEPTAEYNINPTGDGIISDVSNLPEGGTNPWINGNDIDGTKVLKVTILDHLWALA